MRLQAWMKLPGVVIALAVMGTGAADAKPERKTPYFASISAGKARMRTGPGRSYPAMWLYRRADLPVRVIDSYMRGLWLRIEDPGGVQGWMLGSLISNTRTGLVMGQTAELRATPRSAGRVLWRAEPGVVGRLSKCAGGWCWLEVRGRGGFVEANRLWGVEPQETLG